MQLTKSDLHQLDKSICQDSLVEFIKMAWSALEPGTPYIHGWHIDAMAEHLESVTNGDINRLLINIPPGAMKALEHNTPILTLDGWKKHGDLSVGDFVYSNKGKLIKVEGCTADVIEDCYKVAFDNGAEIIAGSGHEWVIEREYVNKETNWKRKRVKEIVSTMNLQSSDSTKDTHARPDRIPLAESIYRPSNNFIIDPYILGAWLGDGASSGGYIYSADEDVDHFNQFGKITHTSPISETRNQKFHRILIDGLHIRLRVLKLLNNKHIPSDYLLSSEEQRLSLLQGLMDTDGTCNKKGEPSFTNKNKNLIDGVVFLLSSLGCKPHLTSRFTMLKGKRYGPHYKVVFTPPIGLSVFRLDRKNKRVKQTDNPRTFSRYVKSVEYVGKRVVKCIQVEGGVYLAGDQLIPTHNSMMIGVMWPAWEWGPRGLAHKRIIGASHEQSLAIRDNLKMRRLIESEWYQSLWPVTLTKDQNAKLKFENDKQGFRQACAVESMTGNRGDTVIWDDPLSVEGARSEKKRETTTRVFNETLPTRLNNPEKSAIVVVMQRLHQDDVSGHIMANDLGYTHLCLPMEFEPARKCITTIGFEDPRTKENELLFPERFPESVVERDKKVMGSYAASGQFQQRPAPLGGGIFKDVWWQYYDLLPKMKYSIIVADTAMKTKEQNDYSVFMAWGLGKDGNAYLFDVLRGKWEAPQLLTQFVAFYNKHKANKEVKLRNAAIEDKASGTGLIQTIKQTHKIPVKPIKRDTQDKVSRAMAITPYIESGYVFLPKNAPWVSDLLSETSAFPNGSHDDQVDVVSDGLDQLFNTKREFNVRVV